ncbi:MAG: glycoside hydrolase family 32 protein, partial [Planctomycetota bacterium]
EGLRSDTPGLEALTNADSIKGAEDLYREKWRPQFHFSSRRGWNNDPNGMVYHDGEWHLFYQHNPYGVDWGNMHWGHAVSPDLLHWRELGDELFPWTMAEGACFSGSAVVDGQNSVGFGTGEEDVLVAAFTDTGCGEAIACSQERGRNFTYYEGNPVVEHRGRDPKVFWYEPDERWAMAVYDERDDSQGIAFYTSPNLKDWTYQSRIDGFYECPELFKLPVDGNEDRQKWVLYAADAQYVVGQFDGETFTRGHEGKHRVHYGKYYASQTFNNAPRGRRIQIGWGQIEMPGMPFNQMMTFPCRLTLRSTDEGVRMFAEPVREIQNLYDETDRVADRTLRPGEPVEVSTSGRLFDIRATISPGDADEVGLALGDREVTYDVDAGMLADMPLKPRDGRVTVRLLVDRPSIEICGNDGRVYRTDRFLHGDIEAIKVFSRGGRATLEKLQVHQLDSVWPENPEGAPAD